MHIFWHSTKNVGNKLQRITYGGHIWSSFCEGQMKILLTFDKTIAFSQSHMSKISHWKIQCSSSQSQESTSFADIRLNNHLFLEAITKSCALVICNWIPIFRNLAMKFLWFAVKYSRIYTISHNKILWISKIISHRAPNFGQKRKKKMFCKFLVR